jgi:H+/Cl- antiporter ClcA
LNGLSPLIFFGVMLVAVISGLCGSGMTKFMLYVFRLKKSFKFKYQYGLYAVASALVMAAMAFFINRDVLGSGKEIMETTLFTSNKFVAWYVPILRIAGPILSFTAGGAGGVFAPALGAGASIGSLVASWFQTNGVDTNMLILTGMVGFLTGVTRSPFTSVILVLEMTDRHNVIFHLILAGMIASLVSVLVEKHSFYDHLKAGYVKELEAEHEPINQAEAVAD